MWIKIAIGLEAKISGNQVCMIKGKENCNFKVIAAAFKAKCGV